MTMRMKTDIYVFGCRFLGICRAFAYGWIFRLVVSLLWSDQQDVCLVTVFNFDRSCAVSARG